MLPLPWLVVALLAGQGAPTPPPARQADVVSIAGAPSKGSRDARLVLIEFSDFQCPLCEQHFRETWPRLAREHVDAGTLRYVYRNLPVEEIHANALGAAQAGVCAHRQGRFWPLHDRLFAHQEQLGAADLVSHGAAVGLDGPSFAQCLAEVPQAVRADMADAERLGLRGTPMFVIGHLVGADRVRVVKIVKGAQPYAVFDAALTAASAAAPGRP